MIPLRRALRARLFGLVTVVLLVSLRSDAQTPPEVPEAKPGNEPTLRYIPGSTVKIEQLLGEFDKERHCPTLSRTFSRFSVLGTDLGYSFEHDGHACFLFGDTVGHVSYAEDTMAMTDAVDPEKGVRLDFLTASKGKYLVIAPPGISMGAFETPAGGISLGERMYVLVKTDYTNPQWTTGRCVLTKFVPPGKFEVLRTISKRPAGQFMTLSLHLQPHPYPLLPPRGPYVFIWGTGAYRLSDLFLSIVPAAHFETGEGTRYFAGFNEAGLPKWSEREADAQPVVKNGTMGDVSVTWCKDLGLWLMTYDRARPTDCVAFSYSRTPWGPWSEAQPIFNEVRDHALGKFIHNPRANPPDGLAGPVIGKPKEQWEAEFGGFYAPYVIERFTKVEGSELHLYYCLSTWNPYVVVLMKSRLAIDKGAPAEPVKPLPAPAVKGAAMEKIELKAMPFPPANVRLLPGPFMDAMERDGKFLLEIDPERLLHMFCVTAGLPSKVEPYGGWEEPKGGLRGHTMGHYLSALAHMYATTGDARFKARGDLLVAELAKVQEAMPARGFRPGFLSAFPEQEFAAVEQHLPPVQTGPWYVCHKIMAGLLDMHVFAGNPQALEVATKLGRWVKSRTDALNEKQMQTMLELEHGGMVEVLANLAAVTGNEEFLHEAQWWEHHALIDPLARRIDDLSSSITGQGVHGNTQVPKIIGAAREYELTGEPRYRDIATFFWERVAHDRSYVNGGTTDGEHFFPPLRFSQHLGTTTAETCVTYNMLKLSRHLFEWEPSAEVMDYYERALYNHILGSQDPATGMMSYYCPFKPGGFKTFSSRDDSFWCCVGTGMENHSKYTESIYFHDAGSLYVNLFIASHLDWQAKGVQVRQETRFPMVDTTRLTFTAAEPTRFVLRLRYPSWAQDGLVVEVNGERQEVVAKPGSYVAVDRTWKTGDVLVMRLPMRLHFETLPHDPSYVAVLYGPIVLAGDLGREGLARENRYGMWAPPGESQPLDTVPPVAAPVFPGDAASLLAKIHRDAPGTLDFHAVLPGQPRDVRLVPFYLASDNRYTVYWKLQPAEASGR